jgi:hypothetical protein
MLLWGISVTADTNLGHRPKRERHTRNSPTRESLLVPIYYLNLARIINAEVHSRYRPIPSTPTTFAEKMADPWLDKGRQNYYISNEAIEVPTQSSPDTDATTTSATTTATTPAPPPSPNERPSKHAYSVFHSFQRAWSYCKLRIAHRGKGLPRPWIVYSSTTKTKPQPRRARFDTDSLQLRVDNCASYCITNRLSDFYNPPQPISCTLTGIHGTASSPLSRGHGRFTIEDDNGVPYTIDIPNLIYDSNARSRLLSPQHWAQLAKDLDPDPAGTCTITTADRIILYWDQRRRQRTIYLDPASNVGILNSAPGFTNFEAYCSTIDSSDEEAPVCFDATVFPYDQDSPTDSPAAASRGETATTSFGRQEPLTTDFDLDGSNQSLQDQVSPDEEDSRPQDASAEFLRWHFNLNHASPKRIQAMARMGILPARLAKCPVPLCTSCLYGKATRRPWRTKQSLSDKGEDKLKATKPGECVSVDQLISYTPGLIAQLRGTPTKKRYQCVTVFKDQFSRFSYVHLQKTTSAEETLEAKAAFELYCASVGVKVLHYRADNGVFADNQWRNACTRAGQQLTFCGVNAHFQNGVAERHIRELQDQARTMMIHASKRWPAAINTNLWPDAIRMANESKNVTPGQEDGLIPIEVFTGAPASFNPKHHFPFGCPIYTYADSKDKWVDRSRVGVYLGPSAQHARTVALVRSLETGLASPQFHVHFDPGFQTMRKAFNQCMPQSHWQDKCHFLAPSRKGDSASDPIDKGNESLYSSGSKVRFDESNGMDMNPNLDNELPSADSNWPSEPPSEAPPGVPPEETESRNEPSISPSPPPIAVEAAPLLRRSQRQRKLTEKGQQYRSQIRGGRTTSELMEAMRAEITKDDPDPGQFEYLAEAMEQEL